MSAQLWRNLAETSQSVRTHRQATTASVLKVTERNPTRKLRVNKQMLTFFVTAILIVQTMLNVLKVNVSVKKALKLPVQFVWTLTSADQLLIFVVTRRNA